MRDKIVELFVVVGVFILMFVGILVAAWSYQTEIFLQNGMSYTAVQRCQTYMEWTKVAPEKGE
jgi:hypothetical protein